MIFCCYNPAKPVKWHLKLFEVSDARTGYVIVFDVYTGKNKTRCALNADVLDPDSRQTTKEGKPSGKRPPCLHGQLLQQPRSLF